MRTETLQNKTVIKSKSNSSNIKNSVVEILPHLVKDIKLAKLGRDKIDISEKELYSVATSLGADVSFFLDGGLQQGDGIGEKLTRLPGVINGVYLLIIPNFHISTDWAYKSYKIFLDEDRDQVNFAGFLNRDIVPFEFFENDFESIVVPAYPEIGKIKKKLEAFGSRFASLSGSGSTVYGIFDDESNAISAESYFSPKYTTFITYPRA